MKLQYTREAVTDLKRLRGFIETENPQAAGRIAGEIIAGIQTLLRFPRLGTKVSSAPNPDLIRDLYILDYQIRYLIFNDIISILRIWHQKEDR